MTDIGYPPNPNLKDSLQIYKEELREDKPKDGQELLKQLEAEAPSMIDVDRIRSENVEMQMRRYAVLADVPYTTQRTSMQNAEQKMQDFLPRHALDEQLSDTDSVVAIKKHNHKPDDVIISYRGTATAWTLWELGFPLLLDCQASIP